jgi:hypothetical protein
MTHGWCVVLKHNRRENEDYDSFLKAYKSIQRQTIVVLLLSLDNTTPILKFCDQIFHEPGFGRQHICHKKIEECNGDYDLLVHKHTKTRKLKFDKILRGYYNTKKKRTRSCVPLGKHAKWMHWLAMCLFFLLLANNKNVGRGLCRCVPVFYLKNTNYMHMTSSHKRKRLVCLTEARFQNADLEKRPKFKDPIFDEPKKLENCDNAFSLWILPDRNTNHPANVDYASFRPLKWYNWADMSVCLDLCSICVHTHANEIAKGSGWRCCAWC